MWGAEAGGAAKASAMHSTAPTIDSIPPKCPECSGEKGGTTRAWGMTGLGLEPCGGGGGTGLATCSPCSISCSPEACSLAQRLVIGDG